jgi:predicted transposase YbfD/YdcC
LPKKTFAAAKASGVHLIVQLKDNQPALYRRVTTCCGNAPILSGCKTVDKNRRNRHETRITGVFDASRAVAGTDWAPYVNAIIQVERIVHTRNAATGLWKTSTETAFYLSNRPIHARKAARKIRDHWAIENRQHYVRDVTMAEDASRIRVNPGIFARLRSFAYNILRFNQSDTIAQDRFAAACGGVDYLLSLNYFSSRV